MRTKWLQNQQCTFILQVAEANEVNARACITKEGQSSTDLLLKTGQFKTKQPFEQQQKD